MRSLHKDQKQRIAALADHFDEHIPAIWNTAPILARSNSQIGLKDDDIAKGYKLLIRKLEQVFSGERLTKTLVDFYVFPSMHLADKENRQACLSDLIAQRVVQRWIVEHPDAYALEQIGERVRYMLLNVFENTEIPITRDSAFRQPERGYYFPQVKACIETLTAFRNVEGVNDFAEAFIWGEWNTDFGIEARRRWNRPNVYAAYGYDIDKPLRSLCRWLDEAGCFGYVTYRAAATQFGSVFVQEHLLGHEEDGIEVGTNAYRDKTRIYTARFAAELIAGFPECAGEFNRNYHYVHLQGGDWLLKALDCIEKFDLDIKQLRNKDDELSAALRRLINISGLASDETSEDIMLALQAFKKGTLLTALPYAGAARNTLLKALAWDDIVPVQNQLFAIAGEHSATTATSFNDDIDNCDDPNSGVVDRYALDEALTKADSKRLARYLKLMKDAKLEIGNTLMLIEAVRGDAQLNDDKIRDRTILD